MLWCEICGKEYTGEVGANCPVCGKALQTIAPEQMELAKDYWGHVGQEQEPAWPLNHDGQPEQAVLLCEASDLGAGGEIAISMLRAFGVPVVQRYPGDGQLGKVILGFSGYGFDLYVPESMLELAKELMTPSAEEQEGAQ